jgi:signal transduction histidine kinase
MSHHPHDEDAPALGAGAGPRLEGRISARLVSKAGHDIAQPLHALALYLSALERRLDGEALDILAKASAAADSLSLRFETLLDYARLHYAQRSEDADIALGALLEQLLQATPTIARSGDGWDHTLRTDPALIEMALRRLISFGADRLSAAQLSVNAHERTLSIELSGACAAAVELDRIFEPFSADGVCGDDLGLGLPIVQASAKLLGMAVETSFDGVRLRLALVAPLS